MVGQGRGPVSAALPTESQLDAMSDRTARVWINRLHSEHPEVVELVEATVEVASPLAGPVRVLREIVAALA